MTNSVPRHGSTARPDNLRGLPWALLAAGLYATVGAMAKTASADFHVLQILFFRQILVFLSALPTVTRSFPTGLKTRHPALHTLRLAGAFTALSCGILAVTLLPLSTATTLSFAQVFFVSLLAMWVLGERVDPHRIGAILVGFIGIVIVIRPGMAGFANLATGVSLLGALGAAVAVIAVRRLSQTESTATLLLYQAIFVGALSGIPLFRLWVTPDLSQLIILLAMGALATAGQWVGVRALRLGEASVISGVQYVQLVYAAGFGWILFGELPDRSTVIGGAVIVGAALYILRREQRIRRARTAR